jgi:hypothetical protein
LSFFLDGLVTGSSSGGRAGISGSDIRISNAVLRSMPASGAHTTRPKAPLVVLSTCTTRATARPAG